MHLPIHTLPSLGTIAARSLATNVPLAAAVALCAAAILIVTQWTPSWVRSRLFLRTLMASQVPATLLNEYLETADPIARARRDILSPDLDPEIVAELRKALAAAA
jgi:hypothetical protein